jgi:hypothetical protein
MKLRRGLAVASVLLGTLLPLGSVAVQAQPCSEQYHERLLGGDLPFPFSRYFSKPISHRQEIYLYPPDETWVLNYDSDNDNFRLYVQGRDLTGTADGELSENQDGWLIGQYSTRMCVTPVRLTGLYNQGRKKFVLWIEQGDRCQVVDSWKVADD